MKVAFGLYSLDTETGELWKRADPIRLAPQPTKLLILLVERAGRLISREEVKQLLWDQETFVDFDQSLNACVRQIRAALNDSADKPVYVETLSRRGYRFIAEVAVEPASFGRLGGELSGPVQADSSARIATETETAKPEALGSEAVPAVGIPMQGAAHAASRPLGRAGRSMVLPLATGAAALLLAMGGFFFYIRSMHRPQVLASSAIPATVENTRARPALAVLCFENKSGQPQQQWISATLAEMLTIEMNSDDRLRVIPSEDVVQARNDLGLVGETSDFGESLQNLHKALGSNLFVEGSYTIVNTTPVATLRLTVRVEDTATGKTRTLFNQSGHLNDLYTLVKETSAQLRGKLFVGQPLLPDDPGAVEVMSPNRDAMRFYSEGIDALRNYDAQTARGMLERSIKADPAFAMAHLELAEALNELGSQALSKQEAAEAFRLSADLPRVQKLSIEAAYRDLTSDHERAVALYKALWTFYPDDVKWGLELARVQEEANLNQDSIATIAELRRLSLTPSEQVDALAEEAYNYLAMGPLPDKPEYERKARAAILAGLEIAQKQGGKLLIGKAYRAQCNVFLDLKPQSDAIHACNAAREIYQSVGNLMAVASMTNNIAAVEQNEGNLPQALAGYQQAEQLFKVLGDVPDVYAMKYNRMLLMLSTGDLDTVVQLGSETTHDPEAGVANSREASLLGAFAYIQKGDLKEARRCTSEYTALAQRSTVREGKDSTMAWSHELLGEIAVEEGNLAEARKQFGTMASLAKQVDSKYHMSLAAQRLAALDAMEGKVDGHAIEALQESITTFTSESEGKGDTAFGELTLAQAELAQGKTADAARALDKAKALHGKGDFFRTHLDVLLTDAAILEAQHRGDEAARVLAAETQEAHTKGFQFHEMVGEIRLAKLKQRLSPSAQEAAHLKALAQSANEHGFKGLARQALSVSG